MGANKPKYGDDQRDFAKTIQVVSVRQAMGRVTLGRWDSTGNVFSGFTTNPEKFHVRRLLARNGQTSEAQFASKQWDLCDRDSTSLKATILTMREMDRVGDFDVRERWIPNTGEFLVLSKVALSLRSDCGALVNYSTKGDDLEVYVAGAQDRGFNANMGAQGNVYNNSANSSFEVALVLCGDDGAVQGPFVTIGKLINNNAGTYKFECDGDSPLYEMVGAQYRNKHDSASFLKNRIWMNEHTGYVEGIVNDQAQYVLAIRPESPTSAKPGDDLLLQFGIRKRGETTAQTYDVNGSQRQLLCTVDDSSYIAQYDKKMLWRANLYLEEAEEALGGLDWNDAHPWNAPPTATARANNLNPSWGKKVDGSWDESWGYNEWNRRFDIDSSVADLFTDNKTVGLANLKQIGDGKQVVSFGSFTPIRTLKTNVNNVTAENVIRGTVAYSYPQHRYEPAAKESDLSWSNPVIASEHDDDIQNEPSDYTTDYFGNPGSIDSPFDYIWKMRQQVADLGGDINDGHTSTNKWWDYDVSKPAADIGTSMTSPANTPSYKEIRYIPGLGLYLKVPGHSLNEKASGELSNNGSNPDTWTAADNATGWANLDNGTHKRRNASWIIEAGADCIGFAQRAASWRFTNSDDSNAQSTYNWKRMPRGMMEYNLNEGSENPYPVINDYQSGTNGYRMYPILNKYGDNVVQTRDSDVLNLGSYMKKENWTDVEKKAALKKLMNVVPGDIWVKDTTEDSNNTVWGDHIAIIASVPANSETYTDPQALMNDIILIEGEFTNKIQSVIKRLTVGDYNRGSIPKDRRIYSHFTTDAVVSLNCQTWAVRRLK